MCTWFGFVCLGATTHRAFLQNFRNLFFAISSCTFNFSFLQPLFRPDQGIVNLPNFTMAMVIYRGLKDPAGGDRPIPQFGQCAWFLTRAIPRNTPFVRFEGKWKQVSLIRANSAPISGSDLPVTQIFGAIQVYAIEGEAGDLYFEWVLPESKANRNRLWSLLELDSDAYSFFRSAKLAVRPIYVEKSNGAFFGRYMSQMIHDHRRAKCLPVALHGRRNLVPCEHCENRFEKAYRELGDDRAYVMWPFFDCVSVEGYMFGACANCIYHVEAHTCSFAEHRGHPEIKILKAPASDQLDDDVSENGYSKTAIFLGEEKVIDVPPRKLSPAATPRCGGPISYNVRALEAAQREEYRGVR